MDKNRKFQNRRSSTGMIVPLQKVKGKSSTSSSPRAAQKLRRGVFGIGPQVNSDAGLPSSSAITVVTRDSFSRFSFAECCKYVVFILIFTLMMVIGRGQGVSNYYISNKLDSVIRSNNFKKLSNISKAPAGYEELTDITDIYDFTEQVLIPVLFLETYSSGATIVDSRDRYMVGLQNKLLGGVRIRQIRARLEPCSRGRYQCADEVFSEKRDKIDTTTMSGDIAYRSGSSLGETTEYHGVLGTYIGGGHVVELPPDRTAALAMMAQLRANDFLDVATRVLFMDFNVYNPSLHLHCVARLSLEMPATGGIISKTELKTWRFERYTGEKGHGLIALEILFLCMVAWFTLEEFYEMKTHGLRAYLADRWNVLDWVNLILMYITIGWRLQQYSDIAAAELYTVSAYHSLRDLQWSFQWENYINCANGFLLWLKIFKYMTFSHRVRFLFTMLERSSKDLFIFTIVLFVFYLAFGMAGFLSFSSDVSDYRSLTMSIMNLMRYTITDMDREALTSSNRYLGNMFYVGWSVLMILILANVFIAILSEAYATISSDDDEEELFSRFTGTFKKAIVRFSDKLDKGVMSGLARWARRSTDSIFREDDTNRDGKLSRNELAEAFHVEKSKVDQLIDQYDEDGDHQLGPEEVEQLKQQLSPKSHKRRVISRLVNHRLAKLHRLMARITRKDKHKSAKDNSDEEDED